MKRRSSFEIMMRLIGLVKPLLPVMLVAITLGTIGYLCAIFLTIIAAQVITNSLNYPVSSILTFMIVIAISRGILHYIEQYCNHYIAFKLLAIIRHKVFAALRKLCPAKLEGKDKGNLISIITSDIELLEVFYAHTISPIAIAILTSIIMAIFLSQYSLYASLLALIGYAIVGIVIPILNSKNNSDKGMEYRTSFGELNSFVLDSLRGLDETIQYGTGEKRKEEITNRCKSLANLQESLSKCEANQKSLTNLVILIMSFAMLFMTIAMYQNKTMDFNGVLTCTVAMMGSFGPTVALSNLSNNLSQTLASGERVLSLLEEKPLVEEIDGDLTSDEFDGAELRNVSFAYDDETILDNYSLKLEKGKITGIHGVSGSGKSTVLKLLMRFWDVQKGSVIVNREDVKKIPTKHLRDLESYVTQETHLFHDSIANNIALAKKDATIEEIIEASKKASIHDFIMSLPNGYDTEVGELGDTLSGGEKQRIGIARAFLHDTDLILLDEPTSNLDSLNEGIILKSLKESSKKKTVVLVSHRTSTMNICDKAYEMKNGRLS